MQATSLILQLDTPLPLRPYSVFEVGKHQPYVDFVRFEQGLHQQLSSLLPLLDGLTELIWRRNRKFGLGLSLGGGLMAEAHRLPLQLKKRLEMLTATGQVEWIGGPMINSLAGVSDPQDLIQEVKASQAWIWQEMGQRIQVYMHTDALFRDDLAPIWVELGVERVVVARPALPANPSISVCISALAPRLQLGMADPWQAQVTGGIALMKVSLPELSPFKANALLKHVSALAREKHVILPSLFFARQERKPSFSAKNYLSLGNSDRDLSAYLGNEMQKEAFYKLRKLGAIVRTHEDVELYQQWRYLQQAHLLKQLSTRDNPDWHHHYIDLMNVIADFQTNFD